jgi:hypothetical protein
MLAEEVTLGAGFAGRPPYRYEVDAGGEGAEETAEHGFGHWRGVECGERIYQTRAGAEAARKIGNFQAARTGEIGTPRWGIVPEPTFKHMEHVHTSTCALHDGCRFEEIGRSSGHRTSENRRLLVTTGGLTTQESPARDGLEEGLHL